MFAADLMRVTWHCVRFVQPQEVSGVEDELRSRGVAVFDLDALPIDTKEQLLSAIAREMRFPSYFGMNWDALHDCLKDMAWARSNCYVLFVRNADQFWRRDTGLAGSFVESWLFCAEYWGQLGKPFHLVFVR